MADINELQQAEINMLQEDEEIFDLESLITDGVDAKVPISIEINGKKYGAMIKPLNNIQWNNATRKALNNYSTTNEIEIVKQALYNKNGDEFPEDVIDKFPTGVVVQIFREIAKISGVELNSEENVKLMKELMGF